MCRQHYGIDNANIELCYRDEGAVGRGSKPKAGLCGFSVSDLLIPGFSQPWELDVGKPQHIASSLDVSIPGALSPLFGFLG